MTFILGRLTSNKLSCRPFETIKTGGVGGGVIYQSLPNAYADKTKKSLAFEDNAGRDHSKSGVIDAFSWPTMWWLGMKPKPINQYSSYLDTLPFSCPRNICSAVDRKC